jgi:hypothetical protein
MILGIIELGTSKENVPTMLQLDLCRNILVGNTSLLPQKVTLNTINQPIQPSTTGHCIK